MENKFNHKDFEANILKLWKNNNFFKPQSAQKTFSILMPPPNVTGKLHLGHAWNSYYPDLLIRYKQMNGYKSIWYPGMDHAGIATQIKVEEQLWNEQHKTRKEIGREEFIKLVWNWKDHYANNISSQWDKMGLIIDLNKSKFTLDKDINSLVINSFIDLYNEGFIYKAKRMINWDCQLKTALANVEIEHKETMSKMYHIKYKVVETGEYIIVSTTRPETIYGDKTIFVNPTDERYKKYSGMHVVNPLTHEHNRIMFDTYIDVTFGSGAMKCTPAHDFNDYDLAKKHNLEFINIFNEDGTLNELCKHHKGLDRFEARKQIVKQLEHEGLMDSITDHKTSVAYSQRSQTVIEPRISEQWFLKASKLSELSHKNQETENKVDFYPARFENTFLDWVSRMEDWCISRQLWWGHRIPAWYKDDQVKVQIESPGEGWRQDDDVLDTWYSSALWPLAFIDENVISKSDNSHYLSDTLFTGYDIIFFWVSRMIFQSLKLDVKKRPPFKNVIIHGLIRDKNGKKMSKSLGNGVDPMDVIEKWGSDALKFFLVGNSTPGQDIKYNEDKVNDSWDFLNKVFNITKFLINISKDFKVERTTKLKHLSLLDKYVLNEFNTLLETIRNNVEKYNLTVVVSMLKKFVLEVFSSNYLEMLKSDKNNHSINNALNILVEILITLHPFIPFTSEYLYQSVSEKVFKLNESILTEKYPTNFDFELSKEEKEEIDILLGLVKASRIADSNPDYKNNGISLISPLDHKSDFFNKFLINFGSNVRFNSTVEKAAGIYVSPEAGIIYYDFNGAKQKDKSTLIKEAIEFFNFELKRAVGMINNKKFVENADAELVQQEKDKITFYTKSLEIVNNEINK